MLHTTNNFDDVDSAVLRRGDAVVYFTASWCVPCRQMKPQFARASVIDADRDYFIVDIDETPDVVSRFDIQSVPTIIFFEGLTDATRVTARKAEEIVGEISALTSP